MSQPQTNKHISTQLYLLWLRLRTSMFLDLSRSLGISVNWLKLRSCKMVGMNLWAHDGMVRRLLIITLCLMSLICVNNEKKNHLIYNKPASTYQYWEVIQIKNIIWNSWVLEVVCPGHYCLKNKIKTYINDKLYSHRCSHKICSVNEITL